MYFDSPTEQNISTAPFLQFIHYTLVITRWNNLITFFFSIKIYVRFIIVMGQQPESVLTKASKNHSKSFVHSRNDYKIHNYWSRGH